MVKGRLRKGKEMILIILYAGYKWPNLDHSLQYSVGLPGLYRSHW